MIFIDANTFYWYYGRNEIGLPSPQQIKETDLKTFLNIKKEKAIPSSVYMEMITHFRDDAEKIRKIIKFINDNNIKIYNNYQGYCFNPKEATCISLMDNQQLLNYANTLLQKKIDIEASFSVVFLEMVRLIYLEYIIDNDPRVKKSQRRKICNLLGEFVSKFNRKKYKNIFMKSLADGYAIKKEAQHLRDVYIDSLNDECLSINLWEELIVSYKGKRTDCITLLQQKYAELNANGLDFNSSDTIMKNICETLKNDASYLSYAKEKIEKIFIKKGFSRHQSMYIKDIMLDAWLDREQKLRKNDIFDMLCVGVLDYKKTAESIPLIDSTTYLISFDKTVKKYLENHASSSFKMTKNFDYS